MYTMFQKIVILVTVVSSWHSVQCQQAPRSIKNKIFEPEPGKYAFEITWDPVPNWDEDDPITGYKFLLWEMHSIRKQHLVDGKLVDDLDTSASDYAVRLPEVYLVSANNRKIFIKDLKAEVWYEYAGLAFTKKGEGPFSSPVGAKIGGGKLKVKSSTISPLSNSNPIGKKSLSYPGAMKIKIYDEPQSFDISWKKVDSVDEGDPILGYKVKVLELKKLEKRKKLVDMYNSETGELITTQVEEYPKLNDYRNITDGNLTEMIAPAADRPTVRFEGWKLETPYEIKISAYTKTQEGPWSSPTRFKINDDLKKH